MPGASEQTKRVKALNANWVPGARADDGQFELMLVTDDDERHVVAPSPPTVTALVALAQADTVLLWDPTNETLIVGNIVGETLPRA
jgi:hypothetical protein